MPKKIIAFHDEETGGVFYVEVEVEEKADEVGEGEGNGFQNISNKKAALEEEKATLEEEKIEVIKGKTSQLLASLKTLGKGVLTVVGELKPDEVEVKTGLKLEFSQGHLIAVFAKAKAEFPFEVTMTWKFEK